MQITNILYQELINNFQYIKIIVRLPNLLTNKGKNAEINFLRDCCSRSSLDNYRGNLRFTDTFLAAFRGFRILLRLVRYLLLKLVRFILKTYTN